MRLNGENIILKPVEEADLNFIYKMCKHPLVYKYEEDNEPSKEKVYEKYSGRIKKMKHEEGEFFSLLIIEKKTGNPVGEIHLNLDNKKTRYWEIGYTLHYDYWGMGYASEANRLVIQYAFEKLNAHKIMGCCNGRNTKSARCMERAGMRKEGHLIEARLLRGEWCDELVYSILDKDVVK